MKNNFSFFYAILIALNVIALIASIFWFYSQRDFEPAITALVLASALVGTFVAQTKKTHLPMKNNNKPDQTILIADDDLTIEDELFKQIKKAFSNVARLMLVSDPKNAIESLLSDDSIVGCITDIVFRSHSELAGVQIAEIAMQNNIPIVVITGHRKRNIGLALEELKRIGVSESKIMTKPITFKQYKLFLKHLRGWILGIV